MSISSYSPQEIVETIRMVQMENLDIRTITMGISLRDCVSEFHARLADRIYEKICRKAARLVATGEAIAREYGLPVINQRISVTPVAMIAEAVSDIAHPDAMFVFRVMLREPDRVGVSAFLLRDRDASSGDHEDADQLEAEATRCLHERAWSAWDIAGER